MKASEVIARIHSLGYGADTEEAQLLMLDMIQKRVANSRRWNFAMSSEAVETEAEKEQVELHPVAEIERVDAVKIEPEGTPITETSDLDFAPYNSISEWNRENLRTPGTPRYWSLRGKYIALSPIPDKVYRLVVNVITNPTPIIEGKTEIFIPDSHSDILVWGSIMDLTFRERDWEGHNFARQKYAELYLEMLAQFGVRQRQTNTHVASSGQWDNYDIEDLWQISTLSQ